MAQSPQGLSPRASRGEVGAVAGHAPDAVPTDASDFARLLHAARSGDRAAFDATFAEVYDELHAMAARVRRASPSDTLSATAIVHEAYLKLVPSADRGWVDREHFLAVAARAMRQILIGAARQRIADKRSGMMVTLDDESGAAPVLPAELVALDEALDRLALLSERQARVVELRFFAGLTGEEIARALGVATPTVQRDWRAARAWLARELGAASTPARADL
jgi:RNA polymerase sigma factor (TIGR02999 family)